MAKPVGLISEHTPVTNNSSSVPLMSCGADSCTKMVHLVCTSVLNKVEPLPDSKQIPESPLLVVRSLGSRIGGPAFANQTASVEVDRKNPASLKDEDWTQDYDFQPVLETKMRRTVFLIYYLLATVYKTGCPTLLAETTAQFAVGSDSMQGLHYCLTPNPHVFCQPSTLFKTVSHLLSNFVQENTLRLERFGLAAQDEKFTTSPSHELVAMVEQDLSYVLFNFDMRDLLHLLDMDQHEVKQLKAMMDEFTEVASALRKRHRAAVVFYEASQAKDGLSTDVTVVRDFIVSPITTSDCEKLKELLNQIEVFFTEHITEKHLGVEEGNSLLDGTSLFLNLNGADVLPPCVNYFDGDIIESALRWRQIYQMNRSAGGGDIFALGGNILKHLKLLLNSSEPYLEEQLGHLEKFKKIELRWEKLEKQVFAALEQLKCVDESEISHYLPLFESALKDAVKFMSEMKLLENAACQKTNSLENSKQRSDIVKGDKDLETVQDYFKACTETELPDENEGCRAFKLSLSNVSSLIRARLKPFEGFASQVVLFHTALSGSKSKAKSEEFWKKLEQTSDFDSDFSIAFPFAEFLPKDMDASQKKNKIRVLNDQIAKLSTQMSTVRVKQEVQKKSSSSELLNQFEQSAKDTSDPQEMMDFLIHSCHRLEANDGDGASLLELLRLVHKATSDVLLETQEDDIYSLGHLVKNDWIKAGAHQDRYNFVLESLHKPVKTVVLPKIEELPKEYRAVLESLHQLKNFEESTGMIREVIATLSKSLAEEEALAAKNKEKEGEAPFHLSAVKCYINRLGLVVRICESLASVIHNPQAAPYVSISTIKGVMKKITFKSVQEGTCFRIFSEFLFPKKGSVLVTERNEFVLQDKYLSEGAVIKASSACKATHVPAVAASFRQFLWLCSTSAKDAAKFKKFIVENKEAWLEKLEAMKSRDPSLKNTLTTPELVRDLQFLKESVVPTYLKVLKDEFSGKCMNEEIQETLLTELDNSQLKEKSERELFRANIARMGQEQWLQWVLPSVLGRKVEFLQSQQSTLKLKNAYPSDRLYPMTFEITLEGGEKKEKRQPVIKLLHSSVEVGGAELERVMQKVSLDVANLSLRVADWSITHRYHAEVLVKAFHFRLTHVA